MRHALADATNLTLTLYKKKVSQINNREYPNLTANNAMPTSALVLQIPRILFNSVLHMYQELPVPVSGAGCLFLVSFHEAIGALGMNSLTIALGWHC